MALSSGDAAKVGISGGEDRGPLKHHWDWVPLILHLVSSAFQPDVMCARLLKGEGAFGSEA